MFRFSARLEEYTFDGGLTGHDGPALSHLSPWAPAFFRCSDARFCASWGVTLVTATSGETYGVFIRHVRIRKHMTYPTRTFNEKLACSVSMTHVAMTFLRAVYSEKSKYDSQRLQPDESLGAKNHVSACNATLQESKWISFL